MARYNVDLQDNEGNAYQIMANPDSVAEFSPAVNRENIRSGETYRVIFGKIMKYLSEVGNAAYVGLANNCTTTIAGFALDARQGKELMDRINELNRDLGAVPEFVIDKSTGKITGYKTKAGADTVFPFSSTPLLNMKFSQMPKVDYYTSTNLVFENPGYNRLKVTDCNANYWWVYNCPWFDVNNWGNELETKYQIGKRNDTVFDITNAKYVLIHTKQSENNNSGFGGCKFNLCNE